jgi:hypothetical protein
MIKVALAASAICLATVAVAQEDNTDNAGKVGADGASIGQLIADGYEIKAAVPNGKRFVVFLQKDSTGYACEMSGLSTSQCGKIN